MRGFYNLDGMYNNGTAVRHENTELLHHAFGSVGGSSKEAEPDFEFSEPIT